MVKVKEAYRVAEKMSEAKYLKQIFTFDTAFGFIFSPSKTTIGIGGACILVSKEDVNITAILPIVFENLEFLNSGIELPLTSIL